MSCNHVFVAPGQWCRFCNCSRLFVVHNLSTPDSRAFWGEPLPGDVVSSAYRGVPDERMAVRDASAERERDVALWAAAMVAVLVCLGQLAAERAPPSKVSRFSNLEVD